MAPATRPGRTRSPTSSASATGGGATRPSAIPALWGSSSWPGQAELNVSTGPAAAQPAKARQAAQRAFLHGTLRTLRAAAKAGPAGAPLFVGATPPAYYAYPAAGRVRRGTAATPKSNRGRANLTLNGAPSWPGREAGIARAAALIADPEVAAVFQQIADRHPSARTVASALDNAIRNRTAVARERHAKPGCRVRAVHPPLYAPNLNLIERLWRFYKR